MNLWARKAFMTSLYFRKLTGHLDYRWEECCSVSKSPTKMAFGLGPWEDLYGQRNGSPLWTKETDVCPEISTADPVAMVALTPMIPAGAGDQVQSQDFQVYSVAAAQFGKSLEGLRIQRSPLLVEVDGIRRIIKDIKCGKKIWIPANGLANFILAKSKGLTGSWRLYSLKDGKRISEMKCRRWKAEVAYENRKLEDQLRPFRLY